MKITIYSWSTNDLVARLTVHEVVRWLGSVWYSEHLWPPAGRCSHHLLRQVP